MITSFFKPKQKTSKETSKRERDETETTDENQDAVKRIKDVSSSSCAEVQELLSYMPDTEGAVVSWRKELDRYLGSAAFQCLAKFVCAERKAHTIYPKPEHTFAALNLCPLDSVKVVIVGQDPYHGPGQAHGLSFSVLPGQAIPPSLKNIYSELKDDAEIEHFDEMPRHGHLVRWAKQGVLMLNAVLTVRRGQANSHQKKGWEKVTDEILRAVDRTSRARGKGVVFLLWGRPATAKAQALLASSSNFHTIICTSHPSPLGARKTKQPFMGSKCFSRCNAALKAKGHDEIDWNVDGL